MHSNAVVVILRSNHLSVRRYGINYIGMTKLCYTTMKTENPMLIHNINLLNAKNLRFAVKKKYVYMFEVIFKLTIVCSLKLRITEVVKRVINRE